MTTKSFSNSLGFPVLLVAAGLSGCNQVMAPDTTPVGSVFGAAHGSAFEYAIAERQPLSEAFVDVPLEAGEIIEVTEERYGNGVEQILKLAGDTSSMGENEIRIRMVTRNPWRKESAEPFKLERTTARQIRLELSRGFPGIRMAVANTLSANAYGPFGHATGRLPSGARCIYAWQTLKGLGPKRRNWFAKESARPQLSIRLRICRSGAAGVDLVGIMRSMRITADPARAVHATRVAWSAAPQGNPVVPGVGGRLDGYVSKPPIALKPVADEEPAPQRQNGTRPVKREILVKATPRETVRPPAVLVPAPDTPRRPAPAEVIAREQVRTLRERRRVRVIPAPSSTVAPAEAVPSKRLVREETEHPLVPAPG